MRWYALACAGMRCDDAPASWRPETSGVRVVAVAPGARDGKDASHLSDRRMGGLTAKGETT
jgi:hypothetical protein